MKIKALHIWDRDLTPPPHTKAVCQKVLVNGETATYDYQKSTCPACLKKAYPQALEKLHSQIENRNREIQHLTRLMEEKQTQNEFVVGVLIKRIIQLEKEIKDADLPF